VIVAHFRAGNEEPIVSRVHSSQSVVDEDGGGSWLPDWLDCSTWGASLTAHLVVLGILGLFTFRVDHAVATLIDTAFEDSIDPDQYKFDSTAMDQVGGSGSISDAAPIAAAAAVATAVAGKSAQDDVVSKVDESLNIRIPTGQGILPLPQAEMLAAVNTSGGSDHAAGGVEGAIDRMAYEIGNSLREHKTLVVWLFDVSPSLHEKRDKIADRVENIYRQLNEMNVGSDKALKSAVAIFGEKPEPTYITPEPVDDTAELVKAVRSIKSEDGGKENVFNAIYKSASKWMNYRTKQNRNMMMIIITDEGGSDVDKIETTIQLCKRYGIRCYVIGEEAPLGRKEVVLRNYKLPNGDMIDEALMDRGPEGFFQDRLRLAYWGAEGSSLDFIPSGFGPYGLTRLCAETNGLFLISDTEQKRFRIDPLVMKSYAPDYRPVAFLDKDLRSNLAKGALFEVCGDKYKVESIPLPTLVFPAENDTVLRQAIDAAQRVTAETEYRLADMGRKLEAGEKDRAKIQEPRWRAVYDLAYGRALAMQARFYGYNAMLAEMKSSPKKFEKAGNNQWRLVASKEINSGAVSKKLVSKAQDYLKRVIDEHQGTPWAALAEREFSTPLGWEWKEGNYNPAAVAAAAAAAKKAPKFANEVDPKTGKVVKKQLPDGPVRKEI
jgi:hypothetical protein